MFIDEVAAATRAGLPFALIDYDALARENNAARAVRDIPVHDELEPAVYRGWMLRAEHYTAFYDALMSRGLQLINTAQQYRNTHHLPVSLEIIREHTFRTIYFATDGKDFSYDALMQALLPFAGVPITVKDYVKSEKHYWHEACYIASSSDKQNVQRVVQRFLSLRGDALEGGLVFREYVDLQPLTDEPQSGLPLTKEYRIFYLNQRPVLTVRYWDVEGYDEDVPPPGLFDEVAAQIDSRFFTMDVAQTIDGSWLIVELGDGQVAGLPRTADEDVLYRAFIGAR